MSTRNHTYLVLTNVPHHEWSYVIDPSPKVIGRSSEAAIRVPERFESVSRRHALAWTDQAGCLIYDLGSRLGTNVNGVWVDHVPSAGVVVGDALWLGGLMIEVVSEVSELARPPAQGYDLDATPVPPRPAPPLRAKFHRLTAAEIDIALWFSRGYENEEQIAAKLVRKPRTPKTVLTELASIFKKLEVHARSQFMGLINQSNAMLRGGVRAAVPARSDPVLPHVEMTPKLHRSAP